MLRLMLMRHAKSSWDHPELDDYDRPLNKRGRKACDMMGSFLQTNNLQPNRIICSSAQRTRETLGRLLPYFDGTIDIRLTRTIYERPAGDYLQAIRQAGQTAQTLLVIGHNTALEDMATILAGKGNPDIRQRMQEKFPTAAIAILDFEENRWEDIGPGAGTLIAFAAPRRKPKPEEDDSETTSQSNA